MSSRATSTATGSCRIDEAPVIEVHIVKSGKRPGGMGKPGTLAVVQVVTYAIFAATGKQLRRVPVDPALLKSS